MELSWIFSNVTAFWICLLGITAKMLTTYLCQILNILGRVLIIRVVGKLMNNFPKIWERGLPIAGPDSCLLTFCILFGRWVMKILVCLHPVYCLADGSWIFLFDYILYIVWEMGHEDFCRITYLLLHTCAMYYYVLTYITL